MSKFRVVLNGVVVGAVVSVAAIDPARAEDAIAALRLCASQADDGMRLRCYDSEMRRLSEVHAAPAVSAPVAAAAAPSRDDGPVPAVTASMTPEEVFGFSGSVAQAEIDRRDERLNAVDKIEAAVTKVDRRPYGEWVVTLANGQVWAQKSVEPGVKVQAGDQVVIRRASLGSFLMSTPAGRSTRVSRIK